MVLRIVEAKGLMKISSWFAGTRITGTQILFWLFVDDKNKWEYSKLKNTKRWIHENAHFKQGLEWLFIFFWLMYLGNWLINLFRYRFDLNTAYRQIIFEVEARYAEGIDNYLENRKLFATFRKFDK